MTVFKIGEGVSLDNIALNIRVFLKILMMLSGVPQNLCPNAKVVFFLHVGVSNI